MTSGNPPHYRLLCLGEMTPRQSPGWRSTHPATPTGPSRNPLPDKPLRQVCPIATGFRGRLVSGVARRHVLCGSVGGSQS
jgi:hypothetical protein